MRRFSGARVQLRCPCGVTKPARPAVPVQSEYAMRPLMNDFLSHEDGAVTVDWVVLTAAIVGLAAAAGITAGLGIDNATTSVKTGIENRPVSNE